MPVLWQAAPGLGWNGEVRLPDPLFLCQGVSKQLQIAPLLTQDISQLQRLPRSISLTLNSSVYTKPQKCGSAVRGLKDG